MNRTSEMKSAYGIRLMALILVLCLAGALGGCGFLTPGSAGTKGKKPIQVYYLNKEVTAVIPEEYIPDAATLDEGNESTLIDDLIQRMAAITDRKDTSAVINGFTVKSWTLIDGILTVNVSPEYRQMSSVREILVRAAMVCTLDQVSGVNGVAITVDGAPLEDADGDQVGVQTAREFILSSGNELKTYEKVQLHLYFANETGDQLIDTYRTVVYNSNVSMERLVVDEMLKGPNSEMIHPTLNHATKVLSVTTRDGVCYVNLDAGFLNDPYDVTPEVAIYSLVNSLTELRSVESVQISVDGDSTATFMDHSLDTVFERNMDAVLQESTER